MSKEAFRQRLRNAPLERERERIEAEAQAAGKKAEKLRRQEEARRCEAAEKRARSERLKTLYLPILKKVAKEFGLREKAEVFAEELGISPDEVSEFVEVREGHRGEAEEVLFGYRVELARRTGRKVGYKSVCVKPPRWEMGDGYHLAGGKGKNYLSPGPKETLTDTLDLYTSLNLSLHTSLERESEAIKERYGYGKRYGIDIRISSSQWKLLVPRFFGGSVYTKEKYWHLWGATRENLEGDLIEGFEEIKNAVGRQWATREAKEAHDRKLHEVLSWNY